MKRTLPPLNGLRAFEAAARHMSFTDAADELSGYPGRDQLLRCAGWNSASD